jgi:plasmid stabilization system protein ParE
MAQVVLSPLARQDLHDIWDYLAEHSLDAADDLIEALFDALDLLAENPGIGHWREDLASKDVKFWSVRGYMIAYLHAVVPMQVARIMRGSRDVERELTKVH